MVLGQVEMKWQYVTQGIPGAICLKVDAHGGLVTLCYREYTLAGWTHWKLIPIDKSIPQFESSVFPGQKPGPGGVVGG